MNLELRKELAMGDKCFKCGKDPGSPSFIAFVYDGVTFTAFKSGLDCEICRQEGIIALYDKWKGGRLFGDRNDNRILVNWRVLADRRSEREGEEIIDLLLCAGILSGSPTGNWAVKNDGLDIGPRSNGIPLYFTDEENLRLWAKAVLSNTMYNWYAVLIGHTLSKAEVLR